MKIEIEDDFSPVVEHALMYRGLWLLCKISPKTKRMQARFYTFPLQLGREAMWGVFTVQGKFIRYCYGRVGVEKFYDGFVWRRRMAAFQAYGVGDWNRKQRDQALGDKLGKKGMVEHG